MRSRCSGHALLRRRGTGLIVLQQWAAGSRVNLQSAPAMLMRIVYVRRGNTHLLLFFDLRKSTHFATPVYFRSTFKKLHFYCTGQIYMGTVWIARSVYNENSTRRIDKVRLCTFTLGAGSLHQIPRSVQGMMCVWDNANQSHIQLMQRHNANGPR